jgi:hypothetical protein
MASKHEGVNLVTNRTKHEHQYRVPRSGHDGFVEGEVGVGHFLQACCVSVLL